MMKWLSDLFGQKQDAQAENQNKLILVVDDNETDRMLIVRTVEKMGYTVIEAPDGLKGLEVARNRRPQLILSDCNMPDQTGVEMCKSLKEYEETRNIPFIFLTGMDTPKNVVECFEIDAANYMCKPINPKLLRNQIEEIFKEYLEG